MSARPVPIADAAEGDVAPPTRLVAGLTAAPWSHDLLGLLRRIERDHPDRPRIGDSAARDDEFVLLGEDPFLDFSASTLGRADRDREGRLRLYVRHLGLLGPQGPLPLAVTDEAHGWWLAHDDAFPRFLDLFNHRFLQLFFRAWADARPIAQADRPREDRFIAYVGGAVGLGSEIYRGLDSVPDRAKLAYAGVLAPRAKSACRLEGAIEGLFGVRVEVEEFVGTRLPFEPADHSRLGRANAGLGVDLLLGASVYSVEDRIRIRVFAPDLGTYARFLPGGDRCEALADLVFFVLGHEIEWDIELALPHRAVRPLALGGFGQLGYTGWLVARDAPPPEGHRRDARLSPSERVRERRPATRPAPDPGEPRGRPSSPAPNPTP